MSNEMTAKDTTKLAGKMVTAAREALRNKSGLTGSNLSQALDAIDIFVFTEIATSVYKK